MNTKSTSPNPNLTLVLTLTLDLGVGCLFQVALSNSMCNEHAVARARVWEACVGAGDVCVRGSAGRGKWGGDDEVARRPPRHVWR